MSTENERAAELRGYVEDLNSRVMNGDMLGAFDQYYADDVTMQENQLPPIVGKAANRAREEEWLAAITEFRSAEVKSVGVDPKTDTTLVEWIFDYTHKEWGDVKNHQVSIQRWRGDKIVHERFVYG